MTRLPVPEIRLTDANDAPVRRDGQYVLYWMIAARRLTWNYALDHAIDEARRLGKPLLIFEPLRARYPWASDRLHRFIIEGMQEHAQRLQNHVVGYYPYVEPRPGEGSPLLHHLARTACLVVTDEYPCFFLPQMIQAASHRLPVRLRLVDNAVIMPLRAAERTFTVAHSYRRWMQKGILDVLLDTPRKDPTVRLKLPRFPGVVPEIAKQHPPADLTRLLGGAIRDLPIDHDVRPNSELPGGTRPAARRLDRFIEESLEVYGGQRNHPNREGTSGLSPYLHFGHISPHQILEAVLSHHGWTPARVGKVNGKNRGFWGLPDPAEAFLDQLLVWRELGFNLCFRQGDDYDRYESLPQWALKTLAEHASDPRPQIYSLEQLERAETGDELWNASQRQLVTTGVMHNYLRMLWGKLILNWTRSPQEALAVMTELNNKYALDGRDPNSYSGIFWVLGRYDRAWGPARPIYGNVRFMTSESARRKLRLNYYLQRFGA